MTLEQDVDNKVVGMWCKGLAPTTLGIDCMKATTEEFDKMEAEDRRELMW
jgi:hypothetical protein